MSGCCFVRGLVFGLAFFCLQTRGHQEERRERRERNKKSIHGSRRCIKQIRPEVHGGRKGEHVELPVLRLHGEGRSMGCMRTVGSVELADKLRFLRYIRVPWASFRPGKQRGKRIT